MTARDGYRLSGALKWSFKTCRQKRPDGRVVLLRTLNHEIPWLNLTGGGIQIMTVWRFIAQSFHYHPPVVSIWLKRCWKGSKTSNYYLHHHHHHHHHHVQTAKAQITAWSGPLTAYIRYAYTIMYWYTVMSHFCLQNQAFKGNRYTFREGNSFKFGLPLFWKGVYFAFHLKRGLH